MDSNQRPPTPRGNTKNSGVGELPNSEPFVKTLHFISKDYFGSVSHMLSHTDLDRNYYTLLLICRSKSDLTQKELAEMIEVDKVTMSRKIDHLVGLGYVLRESNPHDRRTILLKPTRKALKLSDEIGQAYTILNEQAFRGISASEQMAFLATAEKLRQNMEHLPRTGVKVEYKQKSSK